MNQKSLKRTFFFTCIIIGMFSGCIGSSSQKSTFYVLSPFEDISTSSYSIKNMAVGVGPVKLPGFLMRPQIVTRQEKNVLSINEFHRWAFSLEEQVTGTIVENLSKIFDTPNIIAYPWDRQLSPAFQVVIDLRRFDGKLNDSVKLEAVWWIVKTDEDKRILTRRTSLVEPAIGNGYKAYVTAQNAALKKLCQKIADTIKRC